MKVYDEVLDQQKGKILGFYGESFVIVFIGQSY